MNVTKKMFVEAYQYWFGSTKKEAIEQYKQYDNTSKEVLCEGYQMQVKMAFYKD